MNFQEIQNLFNITQKLVLECSEEILIVHTIESTSPSWTRSTLSHDQVIQWTKAKVRVYSDSVLCLWKMLAQRNAITRWEGQVECPLLVENYWESVERQFNSSGISSQDSRHCTFFRRSRMIYKSGTLNLGNSQIGSFSCQRSTILIGQEKETIRFVFQMQKKSRHTRRISRKDTGRSSVLEMNRCGMEKQSTLLKESGIPQLHRWCSNSTTQVTQSSQVPVA